METHLTWISRITHALEKEEFRLYAQPIFDVERGAAADPLRLIFEANETTAIDSRQEAMERRVGAGRSEPL